MSDWPKPSDCVDEFIEQMSKALILDIEGKPMKKVKVRINEKVHECEVEMRGLMIGGQYVDRDTLVLLGAIIEEIEEPKKKRLYPYIGLDDHGFWIALYHEKQGMTECEGTPLISHPTLEPIEVEVENE